MRLRVDAGALNEALVVASIVPVPVKETSNTDNDNKTTALGYLFVVKDGKCSIHFRGGTHRVRANVPVIEADGDGMFIYPISNVPGLKFLKGWIDIEYGCDEKEDRYWLKYVTEEDATSEMSTFDPRLMMVVDNEISGEKYTVPAAVLKDALTCVNAHVALASSEQVSAVFKTLQLFDASLKGGDGTMFGADNIRSCYYFCEALCGKPFAIHTTDVKIVTSFLSKCSGDVTIHAGDGAVRFIEDSKGSAVGWSNTVVEHKRFRYYSLRNDNYVLRIPKEALVRAARYVSAVGADRIRIEYEYDKSQASRTIKFMAGGRNAAANVSTTNTAVVGVILPSDKELEDESFGGKESKEGSFKANIGTDHFKGLIESVRGHDVILRIAVMPETNNRREMILFRTVEVYHLDNDGREVVPDEGKEAHLCRVTRYAPSMT